MRIALYTLSTKLGKIRKFILRKLNFFITNKYESLDINDKLDYEIVKNLKIIMPKFKIFKKLINQNSKPYIIAERINHEGILKLQKK